MSNRYLSVSSQISSLKKRGGDYKKQKSPFFYLFGFLILSQCTLQGPPKVIILREGEVLAQQGDTVYSIAHKYGVSVRALVEANGLVPPYTLCTDQKLVLPCIPKTPCDVSPALCPEPGPQLLESGSEVQWEEIQPMEPKVSQQDPVHPSLMDEVQKSDFVGTQKEEGNGSSGFSTKTKKEILKKPTMQKSTFSFSSPVQNFKSRPKESGVCLTVEPGEKVRSAAPGTILFAGSRTVSEDPLILIQHEGGWLTAYGSFDKILVTKGQTVTSKTFLGTIKPGKELYFEMRKDRKIVNPVLYIK